MVRTNDEMMLKASENAALAAEDYLEGEDATCAAYLDEAIRLLSIARQGVRERGY